MSAWVEDVPNFLDQYILDYAIHTIRVKVKAYDYDIWRKILTIPLKIGIFFPPVKCQSITIDIFNGFKIPIV